jgi:O-antigen/teichoic acid export membrane protein
LTAATFASGTTGISRPERSRRARVTSAFQIANRIVNTVVRLFSIPLALSLLGREQYGIWLTLLSIITWFSVADLGMPSALVNPLAQAIGSGETRAAQQLVSSVVAILLAGGLALAGLILAAAPHLPLASLLGAGPDISNSTVFPAVAVVAVVFVGLLGVRVADVVALAMQRGHWAAAADSVGAVVSLGWLLILRGHGSSLAGVAAALTCPATAARVALWLVIGKASGGTLLPRPAAASWTVLRRLAGDAGAFLAGAGGEMLVLQTTNIVIAHVSGADNVPLFAIPYQLFFSAFVLLNAVSAPLWPAYAEARAAGDWAWIRTAHRKAMMQTMALATCGFFVLAALSPIVIRLWVGASFVPPLLLTSLLAAHFVQWAWSFSWGVLLTGLGLIREKVLILLVYGVVHVAALVFFGRALGLVGYAIGMLVAMALAVTWTFPCVARARLPQLTRLKDSDCVGGSEHD